MMVLSSLRLQVSSYSLSGPNIGLAMSSRELKYWRPDLLVSQREFLNGIFHRIFLPSFSSDSAVFLLVVVRNSLLQIRLLMKESIN